MIRSILLVVLLLVVLLLIIFAVLKIKGSQIKNYYDTENRYSQLISSESYEQSRLPLFARDIAVINADTRDLSDVLTSEAGFLTKCAGENALVKKEAMARMNPASTTKIMTALCAIKYGNLDDQVTITEDALITEEGASLAHVKPGQTYTLRQLLYGLLLPSGNDAANAIAIHIGGSIEGFVDLMNKEAADIGASDTHFSNPHGMTAEDHYTTAYDLYLMMNEAVKYKEFTDVCCKDDYNVEYLNPDGTYGSRLWKNTNKFILKDRELPEGLSVVAGKTGTTYAAGHCLVLAVKNENEDTYIGVILGSDSTGSLYDNMDYIISGVE